MCMKMQHSGCLVLYFHTHAQQCFNYNKSKVLGIIIHFYLFIITVAANILAISFVLLSSATLVTWFYPFLYYIQVCQAMKLSAYMLPWRSFVTGKKWEFDGHIIRERRNRLLLIEQDDFHSSLYFYVAWVSIVTWVRLKICRKLLVMKW